MFYENDIPRISLAFLSDLQDQGVAANYISYIAYDCNFANNCIRLNLMINVDDNLQSRRIARDLAES